MMKSPAFLLVVAALSGGAAVLSGCVEPSQGSVYGYQPEGDPRARKMGMQAAYEGSDDSSAASDGDYAPEAESASEPLQFGMLPPTGYRYEHLVMMGSNTKYSDEEMSDFIIQQVGGALSASKVRSVSEPEGADVLLRVHVAGCGFACSGSVDAISAASKRTVRRFSFSSWPDLANQVNGAFAPGRSAYKLVVTQRVASQKREAGAQGVSREDIATIVKAAVSGAQEAKPDRPAGAAETTRSDVDAPRYRKTPRAGDYAVVIGIEKYSGLPDATFAEHDAQAVRAHLVALGFPERNIVSLIGPKATRAGLVKTLDNWLPANVRADSTVFVYFSGHGAPKPETGEAYLVPWDGDPGFLEESAYPVKRLYDRLGKLPTKKVLVALDACFSGAGGRSVLAKGTRPLVSKVSLGGSGGVLTLAAAGGSQISGTIDEQGHGAFTYYLLRGLNGAAKDDAGRVTVRGLYDYVLPNVQDAARRSNRDQSPALLGPAKSAEGFRLR